MPSIEQEIMTVMREARKGRATMMLIGYIPGGTSLSNVKFFYECAVKHGKIARRVSSQAT